MFVPGGVRSFPVMFRGYTVWRLEVAPSVETYVYWLLRVREATV